MIGRRLGPFRIDEQLGAGGMGIVYRAFDTELQRSVAIKVLTDPLTREPTRDRLLDEARAASALNHPHICTVYGVHTAGAQPYIVMEHIEGRRLTDAVPPEGFPIATCLKYGSQIAEGLAHAHEQGVIHRDLKSANVMISPSGRVKILDFGLARRMDADKLNDLTRSGDTIGEGRVSGTLAYMPPEVLRGERADVRSDIWALGIVLYEIAAGGLPFTGSTGFELSAAILREPAPPLPARVPAALRLIIERCLAKEPADRYQRASEVGAALQTCQALEAVGAEPCACPECGATATGHSAYCPACGAPLTVICANCHARSSTAHRFCSHCGHALTPARDGAAESYASPHAYLPKHLAEQIAQSRSLIEGERKQVTALFCHVPNAAAVAERLGHEEMHRRLSDLFQAALEEIHRYEGTINQFVADGFMALFGAPIVHEDDARRAVLAATAIEQRLRRKGGRHDDDLLVQIGVNTGPVVVGRIAENLRMDYTAIGDTTKLASVLQQFAQPGTVLIGEATRRLLQDEVSFEAVELNVPWESRPVRAYRLIDVSPGSGLAHRLGRTASPFVGRAHDLAALNDLVRDAAGGQGQAVSVVAEPGMGKSRLLFELRRTFADTAVTFREGRCLSYASAIPYAPILDIVREQCGISAGDAAEEVRRKISSALRDLHLSADEAVHLCSLLGVADGHAPAPAVSPDIVKARTFEVLRQLAFQESRQHPLALIVEDLHWLDKTSEEYLQTLVDHMAGVRLVLIATYRPGYQPPWMDRSYATQIRLRPLSAGDSLEILTSVIEARGGAHGVSSAILNRAEGNPFFLEELAQTVLDGASDQAIPDTVQGVIMARIDRLPDTTKRLLQTASVLGRESPLTLLRRVWDEPGGFDRDLVELRRLEFVYERAGADGPICVFKHALTQDVAYGSLLTVRRQTLHAAAARALEELYADRLDEVDGALAYHYARTELADRAVAALLRVAEKAARVYANTEAIAHLESARTHAQKLPDTLDRDRLLIDITLKHGHSLYFLGRFRESVDLLLQQQARLERLGDPSLAGAFFFWLAHMYSRLGDQARAKEHAERAIDEARRAGDEVTLGRAHGLLALEGHWAGRATEGIAHGEEAVARLEQKADHWWLGMAHFYVAMNHLLRGRFEEAIAAAERARETGKRIGDPRLQTYAGFTQGWALASRGDGARAIDECRRSLDQAPDRVSRVYASVFLGYAYLEQGNVVDALAELQPAHVQLSQFGFPQWHGWSASLIGEALRLRRELDAATAHAQQGLEIVTRAQYWYGVGFAHRIRGRIARDAGDLTGAGSCLRDALQTFVSIDAGFEEARTRLDLAALARALDDAPDAESHVRRALTLFAKLETPVYVDRTRAFARESSSHPLDLA